MPGWQWRLRTRVELFVLRAWMYRLTIVGVALALFGLASVASPLPVAANLAAGLAGAALSILDIAALRGRLRNIIPRLRDDQDFSEIRPSAGDAARVVSTATQIGLLFEDQSRLLRSRDIPTVRARQPFEQGNKELRERGFEVLALIARGSTIHNDNVLGLASDLPRTASDDDPVVLRPCSYYDFVTTNELANYDFVESGRWTVFRGRETFVDAKGHLRSIAQTDLANVVGVSTLALSTDGALVLITQSRQNAASKGRLAPSGSGSLEQRDFAAGPRDVLQSVIIRGAERELEEECNIDPSEIESTHVIGYGRWLNRGAKPEFLAVTLLNLAKSDIDRRSPRRSEQVYVDEIHSHRLAPVADWDPARPLHMLPSGLHDNASLPLAFALSALADCIRDDDWPPAIQLRRRLAA